MRTMSPMSRIQVHLKAHSVEEARRFYCEDLGLFAVHQDYGMDAVSLVFERNPNVFLILSAGSPPGSEDYAFALEVEDCGGLFDQLRAKPFVTGGRILSEEVFEYPLGKNFLLRDPSGNRFLIFREDV